MTAELPLADELGSVFARVSGLLLSREVVDRALALLTTLTKETFPGTSDAGITLLDEDGNRVTAAATDALVEEADLLQYELGRGPCLTAWEQRTVVRIGDIAEDDRWPEWAQAAAALGMRSLLSAPVVAGSDALGAVKVYAAQPRAYDDRDAHRLTLFATQAAIFLVNLKTMRDAERISEELKDSLRGRDAIALAKGFIMARDGVDERTAFLALVDLAQQESRPVRQVAERLAHSTVRRRR